MTLQRSHGFTVVELLVVILVIGILATVTVVTYNGSQMRARNAQMGAAVKVYKEALLLYRTIHRKYPDANGTNATCLGLDYTNDKCWFNNIDESVAFMNQLKSVYGNQLPMPPENRQNLKGAHYAPITSPLFNTLDGVPTNFLVYTVEGNIACPVGPVASDAGDASVLTFSSTPPVDGHTTPDSGANPASCWVALPSVSNH